MPKGWRGFWLLSLFLVSCASSTESPSPEADPSAPGIIPNECEALLNKSQEWGYIPGGEWKGGSTDTQLEVAKFFSSFHLVPESTSQFYRAFLKENIPSNEEAAKESLEQVNRAQICDAILAHTLLESVIKYPWAKQSRKDVGQYLFQFVHNQQARTAPLISRAAALSLYENAAKKGLVRGNSSAIARIASDLERERAKILGTLSETSSFLERWKALRAELSASEEAREKLARILPLP